MRIGDVVTLKNNSRTKEKCFVEQIVAHEGFGTRKQQQQVSLYAFSGEYIGDYWEDELNILDELISDIDLAGLIHRHKGKMGLVKDFAKVLTEKGETNVQRR